MLAQKVEKVVSDPRKPIPMRINASLSKLLIKPIQKDPIMLTMKVPL